MGLSKLPSRKILLEKIEKNNLTITLNDLYSDNEKNYPAYVTKHDSKREKKVIYT